MTMKATHGQKDLLHQEPVRRRRRRGTAGESGVR